MKEKEHSPKQDKAKKPYTKPTLEKYEKLEKVGFGMVSTGGMAPG